MVTGLVDTAIIVDMLRKYPPARQWAETQSGLALSPFVEFELVEGIQDKYDLQRALSRLRKFEVVDFTPSDLSWASEQIRHYRLSHNIDAFDCLIAAPAYRLRLPLFTRNLKHFTPLLGSLAIRPY